MKYVLLKNGKGHPYPYNVQKWTFMSPSADYPAHYVYCGNGRFCKTLEEVDDYMFTDARMTNGYEYACVKAALKANGVEHWAAELSIGYYMIRLLVSPEGIDPAMFYSILERADGDWKPVRYNSDDLKLLTMDTDLTKDNWEISLEKEMFLKLKQWTDRKGYVFDRPGKKESDLQPAAQPYENGHEFVKDLLKTYGREAGTRMAKDYLAMQKGQENLYIKTESGLIVKMLWSDNPPADPDTATAVIGIYTYDASSLEEQDGGELDIQDTDLSLESHVAECLDFIGVDDKYEIIVDPFLDDEEKVFCEEMEETLELSKNWCAIADQGTVSRRF